MKKSLETLRLFVKGMWKCDHYGKCAKLVGAGLSTIWSWNALSEDAEDNGDVDSEFYFAMEDDGPKKYFHRWITDNRRGNLNEVEASLIRLGSQSRFEISRFRGQTCYQLDPRYIGWSDEEMLAYGFSLSERYLRDSEGRAIPEYIEVVPSLERQMAILSSHYPEVYGKRSKVSFDQNVSGGVAVQVTHGYDRPAALEKPVQNLEVLPEIIQHVVEEEAEPEERRPPAEERRTSPGASEYERLLSMSAEDRQAEATARAARIAAQNTMRSKIV